MRRWTLRGAVYKLCGWLLTAAIIFIAVISSLSKVDIKADWPDSLIFLKPILLNLQANNSWLILALSLAAGAAEAIRRMMGDPWVWNAAQLLLDDLRKNAFNNSTTDDSHYNRVTLFKRVGFLPRLRSWADGHTPWSGWLVPKLRSPGHAFQNTKTVFWAPDEAHKAEGIAGLTWVSGGTIYRSSLPNLDENSSDSDIKRYAEETLLSINLTRTRMKEGKSLARSYCGIPVEVRNKPWGVIVLDSRRPDGIRSQRQSMLTYAMVAKFLGKLLERA